MLPEDSAIKTIPSHLRDLWGHFGPYFDYGSWTRRQFGSRVQKISLHSGANCPNRDGRLGTSGCSFCRVDSFTPDYCFDGGSLVEQFLRGIEFFKRKYSDQKYLAFFQTYSNTYGDQEKLLSEMRILAALPQCCGLVLATRPDCIDTNWAKALGDCAEDFFLQVEIGMESSSDITLRRLQRGHTMQASHDAIKALVAEGVRCGVHLILGLPGESRTLLLEHAQVLNQLPIHSLKLHHLQVLKDTALEKDWLMHPEQFNNWSAMDYAILCADFVEQLRPDIIIERFANESPVDLILHPLWKGLKNYQLASMIKQILIERSSWQGKVWYAHNQ